MRFRRTLILLAVLSASVATIAACSGSKTPSPAVSGSPSPTASAASRDPYLGWWTVDQSQDVIVNMLRITKQGSGYRLSGLVRAALARRAGSLRGQLAVASGRVALRLKPDDRHLVARWVLPGNVRQRVRYIRADSNEVNDFTTNANMDRLTAALADWYRKAKSYPPVSAVRRGGALGKTLRPWPLNPYSGRPITVGSALGDYRYSTTKAGYRLDFMTSDGGVTSVPSQP
jgi:hypothetical protein